jgi:hypothetical protein
VSKSTPQPPLSAEEQEFAERGAAQAELGWTGLETDGVRSPREYGGPAWPMELQGAVWRNTLTLMARRDPVIHGVLLAIDTLVRQVKWEVRINKEQPDEEYRLFVEQCLADMTTSWEDTLSEIMSYIVYGFSFHEIVYRRRLKSEGSKYNDGRDGWRKFPIRSQNSLDHWEFDEGGGLQAFHQTQEDMNTVRIPIERGILFRTRSRLGNPEGPSLLEGAHESWRMKWHVQRIEGIGIERSMNGIAVAWGPKEMWDASHPKAAEYRILYNHLQKLVTQVKQNEARGIVFPLDYGSLDDNGHTNKLYDLTVITTGPGATVDTDRVITRYDQRILTSILAAWLILGQDKVGSFALADSMTDIFAVALGSILDHVSSVFTTYAIPRLGERNGFNPESAPYLWHGDIESVNIDKIGPYVEHLAKVGITFTNSQKTFLTRSGSIPDPTEQEVATMEAEQQRQEQLAAVQHTADIATAKATEKTQKDIQKAPAPPPPVPKVAPTA